MSEVATSLMLNDGADDGAEEGSLELLSFTVRDDNVASNASATSLPALLPLAENASLLTLSSGQQNCILYIDYYYFYVV